MDIFDDVAAFNELRDNAGAVETLTDPVAEEYNAVYDCVQKPISAPGFAISFDGQALFDTINDLRSKLARLDPATVARLEQELGEDLQSCDFDWTCEGGYGLVIRATPSVKLRQILAAATTALVLQKKREGAKIIPLDAEGRRWALTIDGHVRFTGHSHQECKERGDVLLGQRGPDRLGQDAALQRACR
jgi:hypothetical protein